MYPFGSGMPQPTPPQTQYQPAPGSAPFGAGWVQPTQTPTYGGYPSQHSSNAPYPTGPSYPHPGQQAHSAPYPSYGQTPSATNNLPYPGSSFPHNPQHQGHVPTTPSSAHTSAPYPPAQQSPYPPAASAGVSYRTQPSPTHHHSHHQHQGYPSPQMSQHTPYPPSPQQHGAHYAATVGVAQNEMNNRLSVVRKKGSGMPQPTPPQTQYKPAPGSAPFGAGWVQPTQAPTYGGYPTGPSYPPPSQQPYSAPYPSYGQTPSASNNLQYPGLTSPHNPQHQGHVPSSPSSANTSSPYPPAYQSPCNSYRTQPSPTHNHSHHRSHHHSQHQHQGYPSSPQQYGSHYAAPGIAQLSVFRKKGTPTVHPAQNFDPVKDAHALKKAMKGFGTDEDTLISIICGRTNDQRQEIQRQYKTHFGKDLIEDIKSETSGNFEKLLVGLLRPIVDYYCHEICDAMKGIGTDEDVLVEILCTLSNSEIHIIKNQYLRMYGAHLESELKSETSGNFKRLLVSLCTAARDESGHSDPIAAQQDARELLKAGELRVGTDESMFNMILCQRNYQQLKLIFQEYENMTGHTLEKAIKREFSGDIQDGLMAIYKCVTNKSEYFASRLHKSMAGIGTNDKQLIRVIITRCEIDLHDVKVAFERLYGKSLKSWIKGDTSGHYKHALYALTGEQRSS